MMSSSRSVKAGVFTGDHLLSRAPSPLSTPGRGAIYEILCVSREIRNLITNADSDEAIKQQAIAQGMKTLRQDGIKQVLAGGTTLDELLRVVDVRSE